MWITPKKKTFKCSEPGFVHAWKKRQNPELWHWSRWLWDLGLWSNYGFRLLQRSKVEGCGTRRGILLTVEVYCCKPCTDLSCFKHILLQNMTKKLIKKMMLWCKNKNTCLCWSFEQGWGWADQKLGHYSNSTWMDHSLWSMLMILAITTSVFVVKQIFYSRAVSSPCEKIPSLHSSGPDYSSHFSVAGCSETRQHAN